MPSSKSRSPRTVVDEMRPFPEKARPIYFTLATPSLNGLFALATILGEVQKSETRISAGIAIADPGLRTLASHFTHLPLPAVSPEEAKMVRNALLCQIAPSEKKVTEWQEKDWQTDHDAQMKAMPNVEEEDIRLPPYRYTSAHAIMRDVCELFDYKPNTWFDLFVQGRKIVWPGNVAPTRHYLSAHGIESGPFTVVEEGFAGWDANPMLMTPKSWGRVVRIPSYAQFRSGEYGPSDFDRAFSLIFHPDASCVALRSTEYALAGFANHRKEKNVVLDLRDESAEPGEDLSVRQSLMMHQADQGSMVCVIGADPYGIQETALVFSVGEYVRKNKDIVSQNRRKSLIERPLPPVDFTYYWKGASHAS